jgi:predicted dehydrogenase
MEKCRWGVIGAGRIAKEFVAGISASRTGTLVAVASSDRTRALALAAEAGKHVLCEKPLTVTAAEAVVATEAAAAAGVVLVEARRSTPSGRRGTAGRRPRCRPGTASRPCAASIAGVVS